MQNNKASLLYALICLSVAIPLLSGCRFTGGPFYRTSSYQFFNPFSSKSKGYDESALVGKFDDPYGLPNQDVTTPAGGYLKNPPRETPRDTMSAANTAKRNSSDPLSDLHKAGLERNYEATSPTGIASSQSKPADSMFAQTGSASTSNQPLYGTTTPIAPGVNGADNGQAGPLTAQQSAVQQPLNANTPYPANSSTPMYGQSGFDQYNPQLVAGQSNLQNQAMIPGQPGNMMVATPGSTQSQYLNNTDPMFGNNSNAAMPGTTTSPQMVAMNQGVYSGQPFGFADPGSNNQIQGGYPAQSATPQGTGAGPQNTAMPGMTNPNANYGQQQFSMPNGQATSDPGFGPSATPGMNNPSATGTSPYLYPTFDQQQATTQTSPQGTQTQPYPGLNNTATQQPVNSGYQDGFSYFGPPADSNEYRPGSTTNSATNTYGWP